MKLFTRSLMPDYCHHPPAFLFVSSTRTFSFFTPSQGESIFYVFNAQCSHGDSCKKEFTKWKTRACYCIFATQDPFSYYTTRSNPVKIFFRGLIRPKPDMLMTQRRFFWQEEDKETFDMLIEANFRDGRKKLFDGIFRRVDS